VTNLVTDQLLCDDCGFHSLEYFLLLFREATNALNITSTQV